MPVIWANAFQCQDSAALMNASFQSQLNEQPISGRSSRRTEGIDFSAAEIGALAHLYRGEVYRSTMWRTRLDTTTNWSIVLTGVSFSIAFARPDATALPLILAGLLLSVFLSYEARRYRYFNVWRARARLIETDFYSPMLRGQSASRDGSWSALLADDYDHPKFHISYTRAIGRRLRKNYIWIFGIQALAYFGKLTVHPSPMNGFEDIIARATIGLVPGYVVLTLGVAFYSFWVIFAVTTYVIERTTRRDRRTLITIA